MVEKKFFEDRLQTASHLLQKGQLEPYIRYVRFPHYKDIGEGQCVEFDFPVTVLVGANGCNKSSVLHALYGCPSDKSVSDYWYSSKVDPISGNRNRYIYGYRHANGQIVEVIKWHTQKPDRTIDYWETRRPRITDGMEPMPPLEEVSEGRTRTRWNPIQKKVLYLDFRGILCAYDKYFYFGSLPGNLRSKTKQEYIRTKSASLKNAIAGEIQNKIRHYQGGTETVEIESNHELGEREVLEISRILGISYSSARIIRHSYYQGIGTSLILNNSRHTYSEAFAGSGETAIGILVSETLALEERSLVLLDEPETSLHPGAQKRLLEFLLDQVIEKKHQIVLSTHSPSLVDRLPSSAIKVLWRPSQDCNVIVKNQSHPSEAFYVLGQTASSKINIFVEDKLAQAIVNAIIRHYFPLMEDAVAVRPYSGGAEVILSQHLVASAIAEDASTYYLLDGDHRLSIPDSNKIPPSENQALEKMLSECFGMKIPLPFDGHKGKVSEEEKTQKIRAFLAFSRNALRFFPRQTPEEIIWEESHLKTDHALLFEKAGDYKAALRDYAGIRLGKKRPTSGEILTIAETIITDIISSSESVKKIRNILMEIFDQHK